MQSGLLRRLGLISLAMMLSGCAAGRVELIERGDRNSKKRVLIAARQSRFKDAVINHVLRQLEEDECYVKVMDLRDAPADRTGEYGAILVLNSCRIGRMERHAKDFLKAVPDNEKDKIVLLTTTMFSEEVRVEKVDAISSASKMADAATVAGTLVGKIRAVLIRTVPPRGPGGQRSGRVRASERGGPGR